MSDALEPEVYVRLWQQLIAEQPEPAKEYFRYHRQRFYELFSTLQTYLPDVTAPRVLEVGCSGFSRLYKQLFPRLALTIVDRPVELNGAGAEFCLDVCHAERSCHIDLNVDVLSPAWGTPPLGEFDYVICTEVIEHLIVNPVEFLGSLLSLLKPQGYLYLTTPNLFSHHHLLQIARRENPQAIFPKRGQNRDCGHHFREYDLAELCQFAREAGGRVAVAQFSACWDDEVTRQHILTRYPDRSSNLVLMVQRRLNGDTTPDAEPATFTSATTEIEQVQYEQEIARLRDQVARYEQGRFMRFMKRLAETREKLGLK